MSTSSLPPATTRPIVIGIDTHKDIHVAVALDHLGRRLAELHVPTTLAGYVRLEQWATSLGTVDVFGIEGTGSYGAGVARSCASVITGSSRSIDPTEPLAIVWARAIRSILKWRRVWCSRVSLQVLRRLAMVR